MGLKIKIRKIEGGKWTTELLIGSITSALYCEVYVQPKKTGKSCVMRAFKGGFTTRKKII